MAYNGGMTTDTSPILDEAQQARAKALARARRGWQLLDLLVGVTFLAAMLVSGASAQLRDWALGLAPAWWAGLLLFSAAFFGLYTLLTLPLSYFSEYRLEKRYGLLKQGLGGWIADAVKGLVLGAVISGPLLLGLYAVLGRFPETWWLWAIGGYALFTLVAIVAVPVVVMPLFHKFTPLEDPELASRLQGLAERAGARVQGVYRWGLGEKSELANAALTGLGATRRIIVSDTMLDRYSPDEIEAVLAHELGHHCHADIWRLWGVNVAVTSVAFYLGHLALGRFSTQFGLTGLGDFANMPLFLLVLMGASLLAMPLINGYSRRREHAADGFAIRHAGQPAALASALTKLAGQNLADPEPPAWVEWWLHSHPALGRRVARVRQIAGQGADPGTK